MALPASRRRSFARPSFGGNWLPRRGGAAMLEHSHGMKNLSRIIRLAPIPLASPWPCRGEQRTPQVKGPYMEETQVNSTNGVKPITKVLPSICEQIMIGPRFGVLRPALGSVLRLRHDHVCAAAFYPRGTGAHATAADIYSTTTTAL